MNAKGPIFFGILLAIGLLIYSSAYIVDETQQVVVTMFEGQVIGDPITEPGLNFKVPIIQNANFFPKNLLGWDGDPGQIPTLDKTYISVDTFARWKITDPVKFFQTVRDLESALARLDDIIDPAVRNVITDFRLIESVRKSNRVLDTFETGTDNEEDRRPAYTINTGREEITKKILHQAQPKLVEFGIELVDVKIKRINYREEVRRKVYDRMIAERKQIAEKIRSEGQGEAFKILGKKEHDQLEITSGAYKKAEEIKGKADAEAAQIYAEAYNRDPEFFAFVKTLETYQKSLKDNSTLILSTDSEFLKFLEGFGQGE